MSSVSSSASVAQLADDRVEGRPRPRRAAGPAVDDEMVGILGDLRIEVVHEHPERRFLRPAAAGQLGAARGADRTGADRAHRLGHRRDSVPAEAQARRMTGKRSSAIARAKPTDSQNSGVAALVASGCGTDLRVRLDGREPAPGQVVADRRDERAGEAGAARLGRRRDAGDDRGQRRVGERRVEVARPLRARVRGQRPELGVGRRDVVPSRTLA